MTMKKLFLVVGLLVCTMGTFAKESSKQQDDSKLLAQNYNREQIVTAHYVSNGQLVRLKIKISGSQVIAYSTGKDFVGNEQWTSVIPHANITNTNSTFDGDLAREFSQKATLTISNGYQNKSLTVSF